MAVRQSMYFESDTATGKALVKRALDNFKKTDASKGYDVFDDGVTIYASNNFDGMEDDCLSIVSNIRNTLLSGDLLDTIDVTGCYNGHASYGVRIDKTGAYYHTKYEVDFVPIYDENMECVDYYEQTKAKRLNFEYPFYDPKHPEYGVLMDLDESAFTTEDASSFVVKAFDNSLKVSSGNTDLCHDIISKQLEGNSDRGSFYDSDVKVYDQGLNDSTRKELEIEYLINRVRHSPWIEVMNPDVDPDQRCFVTSGMPYGRAGFCDLDSMPDTAQFYVMENSDGSVSLGASNENQSVERYTYLITGKKMVNDIETDVALSLHPGEPAILSKVPCNEALFDGALISKKVALDAGFSNCVYMSTDLLNEYEKKHEALTLSSELIRHSDFDNVYSGPDPDFDDDFHIVEDSYVPDDESVF